MSPSIPSPGTPSPPTGGSESSPSAPPSRARRGHDADYLRGWFRGVATRAAAVESLARAKADAAGFVSEAASAFDTPTERRLLAALVATWNELAYLRAGVERLRAAIGPPPAAWYEAELSNLTAGADFVWGTAPSPATAAPG